MNPTTTDRVPECAGRIISRKGRDLATMWAEDDGLSVWFADNPNGDDYYEVVISFQGTQ